MSDQGQRSEEPSKRRLDKSRKEGKFAVSKEFVSAIQFLGFVWLLVTYSGGFLERTKVLTRSVLIAAFHIQLTPTEVFRLYREVLLQIFTPLLLAGAALMMAALVAQLATTELGISLQKLAPDFTRFNPIKKLTDLPKQGMSALGQALLLLPILGYAVYRIAADNMATYVALPLGSVGTAVQIVLMSYKALFWKAGFVLVGIGCVDFMRQRSKHKKGLKMTKQEVKEENKEAEGNPQMKMRIRRLQRDFARRTMMKEVPKATAVIVNPTHYAVAILYEMDSMVAPRVIAKGRNYLALRIRQLATESLVPIIENQPLAQALYKSADIGQEIPPHLYRAVAEILAYLFKVMNQGRP